MMSGFDGGAVSILQGTGWMLVRAGYFFVADARARLEIVRLELNYWARSVVASLHGGARCLWARPGTDAWRAEGLGSP